MVINVWVLILVLLLLFFSGVALWWMVVALIFYFKNKNFQYARGANKQSGQTETLTCPTGKSISFSTGYLECTDINSTTDQPVCDPMNNDGSVNTSTTQNMLSSLKSACDGKNSCTYTVPKLSSTYCGGTCNQSQLVSTYICK